MVIVAFLVVLGVLFGIAAVVAGRGGTMSRTSEDSLDNRIPPPGVPMTPPDVDALRFALTFRGYRMDQVDDALDRLRDELAARDAELVALRAGRGVAAPPPPVPTPPQPAVEPPTVTGPIQPGPGPSPAPSPTPPAPTPAPPGPPPMPRPTEPAPTPPAPPPTSPSPATAPVPTSSDPLERLRRRTTG